MGREGDLAVQAPPQPQGGAAVNGRATPNKGAGKPPVRPRGPREAAPSADDQAALPKCIGPVENRSSCTLYHPPKGAPKTGLLGHHDWDQL